MRYLATFLEGVVSFVSPCLLPMLPIFVSYFAGETGGEQGRKRSTVRSVLGFVLGFTLIFLAMGTVAGGVGRLLKEQARWLSLVFGLVIVFFGLHYMGVLRLGFLEKVMRPTQKNKPTGFWPSLLFGLAFAFGWTPCVGVFLGSAIMQAATAQSASQGFLLLLTYSLGLGIPFVLSALILDKLKTTIDFFKRNMRTINLFAGGFLVVIGALMMAGLLNQFLGVLTIRGG